MKALNIKATSGGTRGQEGSGQQFNFFMPREKYVDLAGKVYDLCMEKSSDDNKKNGGLVSQNLLAYGVNADKLEAYGQPVFPEDGGTWTDENTENWLEAMNLKATRERKPLEERQAEWDAKAEKLLAAGFNPAEYLSPKQRPTK